MRPKADRKRAIHDTRRLNISFGMRNREEINASFLGAAVSRGLTAAIMNPSSESMKLVLAQEAPSRDFTYEKEPTGVLEISNAKKEFTLFDAVYLGLSAKAYELALAALETKKPLEVIESDLIPALNALGEGYESKKIFLPRLLGGAEAAKSAFKAINQAMSSAGDTKNGLKVVFATVHGDIHDIGKNIVVTLLSNYGFTVVDLGKDVPPQVILEAVKEHNASLLGLSALMTTTVPAMVETVRLVREHCPDTKIMVGGAVLTKEYAETMGADFFGIDAMAAVRFAQSIDL